MSQENQIRALLLNSPRLLAKAKRNLKQIVDGLTYRDFISEMILKFDIEAQMKEWGVTSIQDIFFYLAEKYNRLEFKAPREHLKTSTVLDYLLYKLSKRPFPLEILYFHISDEMAQEKFNKLKRLIENNPLFNSSFKMNSISWSKGYIELEDGSTIKPISYNSSSIGRHPHIIVLDDVVDMKALYSDTVNKKTIDKFYTEILPMMSRKDPDKQIIIVGTVQRKDDLYNSLPPDFHSFTWGAYRKNGLPLSPELYTLQDLIELEKNITAKFGRKYWLKEYMNVPFEAMGLIIKPEHIKYYKDLPQKEVVDPFDRTKKISIDDLDIYQGWDLSVGKNIEKGDYTSCVTIGINRSLDKLRIYVLDVYRARIDFNQRLTMLNQKWHDWKPLNIGVESNAFQYDLIKVARDKGIPIEEIKSIKNKTESFQVELAPYFENGQVYLREHMKELENELLSLPVGEHDDQADGLKFAIKVALYSYDDFQPFVIST